STAFYTLSLHDALPICPLGDRVAGRDDSRRRALGHSARRQEAAGGAARIALVHPLWHLGTRGDGRQPRRDFRTVGRLAGRVRLRSEEHTSELQSRENLV